MSRTHSRPQSQAFQSYDLHNLQLITCANGVRNIAPSFPVGSLSDGANSRTCLPFGSNVSTSHTSCKKTVLHLRIGNIPHSRYAPKSNIPMHHFCGDFSFLPATDKTQIITEYAKINNQALSFGKISTIKTKGRDTY